jgi:hypothetical protein
MKGQYKEIKIPFCSFVFDWGLEDVEMKTFLDCNNCCLKNSENVPKGMSFSVFFGEDMG